LQFCRQARIFQCRTGWPTMYTQSPCFGVRRMALRRRGLESRHSRVTAGISPIRVLRFHARHGALNRSEYWRPNLATTRKLTDCGRVRRSLLIAMRLIGKYWPRATFRSSHLSGAGVHSHPGEIGSTSFVVFENCECDARQARSNY
jgi:hypothetical protein